MCSKHRRLKKHTANQELVCTVDWRLVYLYEQIIDQRRVCLCELTAKWSLFACANRLMIGGLLNYMCHRLIGDHIIVFDLYANWQVYCHIQATGRLAGILLYLGHMSIGGHTVVFWPQADWWAYCCIWATSRLVGILSSRGFRQSMYHALT